VTAATQFLNKYVVPPLTALSENTYLSAIRTGMVAVVPMTIIGGLFLIVSNLPLPGWEQRIRPMAHLLEVPVMAMFGLLAVFVCFAIGYDLGKRLKQEAVVSASMATLIFLMIQLGTETASGPFTTDDLKDASTLATRVKEAKDGVSSHVRDDLEAESQNWLQAWDGTADPSDDLKESLAADLNRIAEGPPLFQEERFRGVRLRPATQALMDSQPTGPELVRLNQLLIEDAYPSELSRLREWTLSMNGLGSQGLFTAVFVALIVVVVQKFFGDRNWVVRLPTSVPAIVYESFVSLTPMFFLVVVFWVIRFVLGVDINGLVTLLLKPLVLALNTLPGILFYAFLVTLLWSVGINGDNAMDAVVAGIFLQYLAENVTAVSQGQPLPYITAYGFFTVFVNVGGTGATIALALILMNSKEPGFRQVSRLSLPTQIFQINEPIFFGIPIVLNPIFMIPYVLNALILTTGTYLLMDWGWIRKPFVNVPWTTPPIIGHFLVTGGDWRAAVWGLVSLGMAMVVYFPFAKVAERQRLAAEATGQGHPAP
jgi:lactose/cellobiose-specific phosphotransferase system IIC component